MKRKKFRSFECPSPGHSRMDCDKEMNNFEERPLQPEKDEFKNLKKCNVEKTQKLL